MAWMTEYLSAVTLSSAIVLVGAIWLYSDEMELEGKLFVALLASYAATGLLVMAELLAPSRELAIWAFGAHNTTIALSTLLIFLFAVVYTGRRRWLSKPVLVALFGWLGVFGALQITNPLHRLLWSEYVVVGAAVAHLDHVPTILFLILINGTPLLYFGGLLLLLHRFLTSEGAGRGQTFALFVGFLPGTAVFLLWVTNTLPGPQSGAYVIGSVWTLIFAGWAIYRYQLFDLAPLARETVFEELDDPVVVVDEQRRVLDYNTAASETFPAVADRSGPRLDDVLPAIFDDADGGDPFVREFTDYEGGEPREFSVKTSGLRPAGEDVKGYAVVISDVTERVEQLRELERQTAQLERFASTLSHDLRNPLNVAQARVRGAIRSGETEKLDAADRAIDRVYEMVEDLLTLAREGRTIDEPERVEVTRVLRAAWETTETKEASLEIEPDADLVVFADPTRLQNVFENLLRNAVQHGGPDVTVRFGGTADGFYVEDDGPGVPEGHREDVFDFDYSTHAEGTGLGLAIVEAIAQAHGWTVEMTEGSEGGAKVVFEGVDVIGTTNRETNTAAAET